MIVNGTILAKRLPRVFKKPVWLLIQVIGGASLQIGRDQSEATLSGGGTILTSANTGGTTSQPLIIPWQGEFWYSTTVDNTQFSVVITSDY